MGEQSGDESSWRRKNIDCARKLIKLTERRAAELGVSIDDYLRGVANGTYPRYTPQDVEKEPLD